MIRETYKKGYSTLTWKGISYTAQGKFCYRKCNNNGYLIFENSGDMFYQDFQENLKSMGYIQITL